jgi:hypothetical protein
MAGQLLLQPQIEFSCFWNTRWIENESKPAADYDALDKDGNLNPTGMTLMIWGNFLGKQMIKAQAAAPLISYCSKDQNKIYLYVINKSKKEENIKLDLGNYEVSSVEQAYEQFGKVSGDMHPVWEQQKNVSKNGCVLKALSITVIELNTN